MKKKLYLILDIEGAGECDCAFAYDVGGVVCNKRGEIIDTFSFVVRDIFNYESQLMASAYYSKKIPLYRAGLNVGEFKLESFYNVRKHIHDVIKMYDIDYVLAYNAGYDVNGLNNTQRWLTKSKYRWFLPYGTKVGCIWHMACQVLCTQKSYVKFIDDNGLRKTSGRLPTSAEIVYAYMIDDVSFIESHTGLEDAIIESAIFSRCMRQKKKMDKSINKRCWAIPQEKVV